MEITITGRHATVSEGQKEYAREKIEKVARIFDRVTSAKVLLDLDASRHVVEATLGLNRGPTIVARAEADDFYAAVDGVEARLETQIRKHKERLAGRRHLGQDGEPPRGGPPGGDGSTPRAGSR